MIDPRIILVALQVAQGIASERADRAEKRREDELREAQRRIEDRRIMEERDWHDTRDARQRDWRQEELSAERARRLAEREMYDFSREDLLAQRREDQEFRDSEIRRRQQAEQDEQSMQLMLLATGELDRRAQAIHQSTMSTDAMGKPLQTEETVPYELARVLVAPQVLQEMSYLTREFMPEDQYQRFMQRLTDANQFISPEHIPEQYRIGYESAARRLYESNPYLGDNPYQMQHTVPEAPQPPEALRDPKLSGLLREPGMLSRGADTMSSWGQLLNRLPEPIGSVTGAPYHAAATGFRGADLLARGEFGAVRQHLQDKVPPGVSRVFNLLRKAQFGPEPQQDPYQLGLQTYQQGLGLSRLPSQDSSESEQDLIREMLLRQGAGRAH